MLPWAISFIAVWRCTNISDIESPMLSKRSGIFLIALGFLLFMTGMIVVDMVGLEGIVKEWRIMDVGYEMLGLLLMFYGNVGRNYKLVKIER